MEVYLLAIDGFGHGDSGAYGDGIGYGELNHEWYDAFDDEGYGNGYGCGYSNGDGEGWGDIGESDGDGHGYSDGNGYSPSDW